MPASVTVKASRREALLSAGGLALGSLLPWVADAAASLPEKRPFRMIEHSWITVRNGTRLSCRLWIPEGAEAKPVGVVLEAVPYAKRGFTRPRDNAWAEMFCPYGFAFARLDLRGSGESEGLLVDEYLAQEQQDIVDVIAFLAEQPWCNGSVGMRGISWGGFNGLQVAALDPPHLKAIVTACSTDHRYLSDGHYIGGVFGLTCLHWGTLFSNVLVEAPDPQIVGPRWRDIWMKRLNAVPAIHARWMRHAEYDDYWKHASIEQDYGAIKCGVYAVGGQVDPYASAILRLMRNLKGSRKALIGPWGHMFPQSANPGPGLDWVVEEVRWWDHWLHGADNGIMSEPMVRAYVNDRTPAETWPQDVPGRWVAERRWPSPAVRDRLFHINATGLAATKAEEQARSIEPHQTVGTGKREWIPFNMALDLPGDQSADDARSMSFDSAPLVRDMEMLGLGEARLRIAADRPVAKAVVRLTEVTPDGLSRYVTYGVLNLTHRDSHSEPALLEPGHVYDVVVPLAYAAHRFKVGSRIRVAISEALWPMLAPSPEPVTLTLTTGASSLSLPVRLGDERATVDMPPLIRGRHQAAGGLASSREAIVRAGPDAQRRVTILRNDPPSRSMIADIATERTAMSSMEMSIEDDDPTSCLWRVTASWGATRADWDYRTLCTAELRMTAQEFLITETVQAFERDALVFEKESRDSIGRKFS